MYNRRICEKCKLIVFAISEEKLESMIKRCRCECGSEEEERIPEYIGKRKLCSKNNVYKDMDDYESNS